jgi:RNA polymerase sigma-70 factor (ECF subfamily)
MITENIKPHYLNKKRGYHNNVGITGTSDEGLIELIAKRRDESAFNEILKRYRDKIFITAYKITNNHNDAEDIVQEVSLTLYRKAHTFRMDSKFSTWLYRLTANESISRLRRLKRRKSVSLDDYMPKFDEEGKYAERPVIEWSQEVEKKVADREIMKIIESAIEELPPTDRTVVVLSDLEELTNPEIGEVLGLSVPAVKARLHRARLFLRKKLAVKLGYSSE